MVPDQGWIVNLHDVNSIDYLFVSGSTPVTILARKSSHHSRIVTKFAAHCFPDLFVGIRQYPKNHPSTNLLNCNFFNILHTLASPTLTWRDNSFTVTRLSVKINLLMRCALSRVCAMCGLQLRVKSRILACPLSPDNLFAHRLYWDLPRQLHASFSTSYWNNCLSNYISTL